MPSKRPYEKQIDYIFQKLKTMFSLNQMLQRFHTSYISFILKHLNILEIGSDACDGRGSTIPKCPSIIQTTALI